MTNTAASNEPNGKVSTTQFYKELQEVRREMVEMERRIMSKLDEMTRVEPVRLVQQVNGLERMLDKEIQSRKFDAECAQEGIEEAKAGIHDLQVTSARGDKVTAVISAAIAGAFTAAAAWLSSR